MSSRGSIWGSVIVGVLIVALAGGASYGWLVATAPSRVAATGTSAPVDSAAQPSPTASPSSTAARPSTGTTQPPTAPTPAPEYDTASVRQLVSLVPGALASNCTPLSPSEAAPDRAAEALAAVRCGQDQFSVVYEMLPDAGTTRNTYAARLGDAIVASDSGGCWAGTRGEVDYTYGRVACWVEASTGTKHISWTFDPMNVLATASSAKKLDTLVSWWWFHALLKPRSTDAGLTPDEQYLMGKVPADIQATCDHYDPLSDSSAYKPVGTLGSIDCYPKGVHVADVGWFRFTTVAALDAWYDFRVSEAKVQPGSGGCFSGTQGETTWAHGRIVCFVSTTHIAKIRWTDDRYQIYGAANATNKNLPSLLAWWQSNNLP